MYTCTTFRKGTYFHLQAIHVHEIRCAEQMKHVQVSFAYLTCVVCIFICLCTSFLCCLSLLHTILHVCRDLYDY